MLLEQLHRIRALGKLVNISGFQQEISLNFMQVLTTKAQGPAPKIRAMMKMNLSSEKAQRIQRFHSGAQSSYETGKKTEK